MGRYQLDQAASLGGKDYNRGMHEFNEKAENDPLFLKLVGAGLIREVEESKVVSTETPAERSAKLYEKLVNKKQNPNHKNQVDVNGKSVSATPGGVVDHGDPAMLRKKASEHKGNQDIAAKTGNPSSVMDQMKAKSAGDADMREKADHARDVLDTAADDDAAKKQGEEIREVEETQPGQAALKSKVDSQNETSGPGDLDKSQHADKHGKSGKHQGKK